eukprot:COSAG02_NODE_2198_length_9544_cov_30.739121_2_plen_75_part_00
MHPDHDCLPSQRRRGGHLLRALQTTHVVSTSRRQVLGLTASFVHAQEGVMTKGYSTNATDAAVQANIVAAGYGK